MSALCHKQTSHKLPLDTAHARRRCPPSPDTGRPCATAANVVMANFGRGQVTLAASPSLDCIRARRVFHCPAR
jgi:hypothetical protein